MSMNMEDDKWFHRENFVEFRNTPILEAISTLFPDQYVAGDAIMLAIKSLNLSLGSDSYLADVLLSHLPLDRILRIIKTKIKQSDKKTFNRILVPINVKLTHWYLGVLQRQRSGEYQLTTQNNCTSITNVQAENNLRTIGNVLSRLVRQSGEADTPLKYQHQRHSNSFEVQDNNESSIQNGRSRQTKNKNSRCLLTEFNNSQDNEKSESQCSSQSLEQVNYGTQPEEGRESFEDYDWEQERMIRYRRNNNEIHRL